MSILESKKKEKDETSKSIFLNFDAFDFKPLEQPKPQSFQYFQKKAQPSLKFRQIMAQSEDESDDRSNNPDESVHQIQQKRVFFHHENSNSDVISSKIPSLKLLNSRFGHNEKNDSHGFSHHDAGSICILASENEFLPDFAIENDTLNFVFSVEKEKQMERESTSLLQKIADMKTNQDQVKFFKVIRNERGFHRKPSILELQEQIQKVNQQKLNQSHNLSVKEGHSEIKSSNTKVVEIKFAENLKNQQVEGLSCKCKKTNCLKLYCECFLNGNICGPSCKCTECMNNVEHLEIRNILLWEHYEKGAITFDPTEIKAGETTLNSRFKKTANCNCDKTGCNKKYCECFRLGLKCSSECRCKNCQNKTDMNEGDALDQNLPRNRKRKLKKKRTNFLNNLIDKMKICNSINQIKKNS